jgi:hypothetical protein
MSAKNEAQFSDHSLVSARLWVRMSALSFAPEHGNILKFFGHTLSKLIIVGLLICPDWK